MPKFSAGKGGSKSSRLNKQRSMSTLEKKANNQASSTNAWKPTWRDKMSLHEGSSVLDLKGDNYFSCSVGRKRSSARYLLGSSDDVVTLLKELADGNSPVDCTSSDPWYQYFHSLDIQHCGVILSFFCFHVHNPHYRLVCSDRKLLIFFVDTLTIREEKKEKV